MYRLINYLFGLTLIYLFILDGKMGDHAMIISGLVLSIPIAYIAFLANWISLEATKAVVVLGTIVFGFGGWALSLALIFFFGASSYLTTLNGNKNKHLNSGNYSITGDKRRDGYQVWANGFWVAVFCILWFALDSVASLIAAFGVIAAATADTWATEIGTRNPGKTFTITNLKQVPPGTDGGVSLKGTLGGLMGALLVSLFIFALGIYTPVYFFPVILLGGIIGLFIDSLAGALFLDKNFQVEAPEDFSDSTNSFTNSFINWMATGITGLSVYLITQFIIL